MRIQASALAAVCILAACTAAKGKPASDTGGKVVVDTNAANPMQTKRVVDKVDRDTVLIAADGSHCAVHEWPHYVAVDTGATYSCAWRE